MNLGHVLITYFSVRIDSYWERFDRNNPHRTEDPLDLDSLRYRVALFESICFSSVISQSSQDYSWLILIDRDLPASIRQHLEEMVEEYSNIHLHTFREEDMIENCDWLLPYLPNTEYTHILTTLLDNDDALPKHFIENMQARLLADLESRPVPFCILGCESVNQWDLIQTTDAPRGYTSSVWHRKAGAFMLAPGFSVMSLYPEINMSNLMLRHRLSKHYLDWSKTPGEDNVAIVRNELIVRGKKARIDIMSQIGLTEHRELHAQIGKPLMVNHSDNVQAARLFEDKLRRKVDPENDLQEYNINWDRFDENAEQILTKVQRLPGQSGRISLKRILTGVGNRFRRAWARA